MNSQTKIKTVIYCRVSSKEQEETGYSLDAQEKLLTGYAAKNNLRIEKIYRISESASGKQVRKTFNEIFQFATKNRVEVILCEKIDRLTRNLKDASTVDDWVKENPNRSVHFVKENFILNQQTKAHDNFVWDMKVAVARFYTNNLSEEVRKGQKEKLAQGWLPTKPPLGYKTIGEKGHKIHILDAWEIDKEGNKVLVGDAAHIRWMFEQYATGNYSLSRLEKELYERGMRQRSGKAIPKSRIHLLLQDVFYYGEICWMGTVYPGKHEPIIAKDVFDKVQANLQRKTKNPHYFKHNSLLKGKVFCQNCGGMLTWYTKKGHWYGHCNNHGVHAKCPKKTCLRQERVEEQYLNVFDIIAPKNEEILTEIENVLREEYAGKVSERENEVARLNGLLTEVRKQKDKYYEAKINHEVPIEYCERKIEELTTDEEALENTLVHTSDKHDEYLNLSLAIHELAFKSKEIYEKATVDEKRLLMSQLFTNFTQDERKITPNYTKAANFLLTWVPQLNKNYELPFSIQNGTKTLEISPLLPSLDKFRTPYWEQIIRSLGYLGIPRLTATY